MFPENMVLNLGRVLKTCKNEKLLWNTDENSPESEVSRTGIDIQKNEKLYGTLVKLPRQ